MKREMRAKVIALSATAIMASFTTFFTAGCSNKDKGSKNEEELTIINDSNVAEMVAEKDKSGSRSNADLFRWKPVQNKIDETIASQGGTETGATLFDAFKIYKNKDGKYFVIDKGEAYELLEGVDGYQIVKEEDKSYVLTSLDGQRLMVFGGEEALNDFSEMLKEKFEAAKADNKVLTIVNGIYVGDPVVSKEVERYDGTRTYYDFEAIMNTCIKGIEEGGYADPISYEKSEDKKSWVVKRTAYLSDGAGGTIGGSEMSFELPIGKTGEVYYDTSINMFIGIVFEEDGKFWVCQDALYNVLGIDVLQGEYTVPGTTEKYDALIIDTAGGSDEPKVVVEPEIEKVETPSTGEPEIEISTVPVPNEPVVVVPTEPVVVNPDTPAIPSYDEDIKEKLGIEVTLSGTNEQQAQQYVDACKAAYPSLPWVCTGTWAGIDVSVIQSSSTVDVWNMTEEEVTSMLNERLAGRDYHDMSIEELYSLMDIAQGCSKGVEIYDYLMSLTGKDFNSGGITVW